MGRREDQLRGRVKDIQTDLGIDRDKRKKLRNRRRETVAFEKLPSTTDRMEFWCDRCLIDFVAPAYKTWSYIHETGAWHSYCPICEAMVYRHITSKVLDPYYLKSDKIKDLRGANLQDMLQPGNYGFNTLYQDPYVNAYMKYQRSHEHLYNKYSAMGLIGKTIDQKSEEDVLKEEFADRI